MRSTVARAVAPRSARSVTCRGLLLAVAVSACAAAGCRASEPPAASAAAQAPVEAAASADQESMPPMTVAPVRILRRDEMTPAEILYGRAPRPDPSVVYKPGVAIVEGGPEAIRSLSPDGLLWTIDPDAHGAERLAVGVIAFVTGRCVGRVLAMERGAAGLTLLLGPVELTDIYERLEIRVDDMPIDFDQVIEQPRPQLAGWSTPSAEPADPLSDWNLDRLEPPGVQPASTQVVSPGIPNPIRVGTHTRELSMSAGPGMTLEADQDGTRLAAQMQFRMAKPRFEFSLHVYKDKVYTYAMLHNAGSLRIAFDAAVNDEFVHNYAWQQAGPSLTIPLAGPTPISVEVRQDFEATTAFSARTSSFGAGATYRLNADLGLSYSAGIWLVHGPKGLTIESPLMSNLTGVSFGPSGMVLRHELTITAGLGAAGFTVGPVFVLHTALGVAQGSTIGVVQCREASLGMWARVSVGYTIPRPVAVFVNFFLRLVNVKPIKDHDSVATPWQQMFKPIAVKPGGQSCVAEGAPAAG